MTKGAFTESVVENAAIAIAKPETERIVEATA